MDVFLVGYKCKAIISPCLTTPSSPPPPPPPLATFFNMPISYLPHPSLPWPAMNPLEHMFEKSLTPSDVGKLNRLVIPKQHAEKYFPLTGEPADKGLLLSFEDESGKPWRFRYSYWTSSQSYVLTKGWSRYVKEKLLDAGDVVVFQRCHADQLLYIGYRRRGESQNTIGTSSRVANAVIPWSQMFYHCSSSSPHNLSISSSVEQDRHLHEGQMAGADHGTSTSAKPLNTKRVRLFGVNLD